MNIKYVTGNDSIFCKIVRKKLDSIPGGNHADDELNDMMSSKDKMDWVKNHPMVGMATDFDENSGFLFGQISKAVGAMLRGSVENKNQFTSALINKLMMDKNFVGLFIVNKPFKEAIIESLKEYNESILPVTSESQKQQE